jgi:hypothetical protein
MRRNWLQTRKRDRVIVYTVGGDTHDGLLHEVAHDGLVLWDVRLQSDQGIALGGEVYIPKDQVRFVQVVATP